MSPAARAQGNDGVALRQTVQQLVDQVRSLQARVKELEAAQAGRTDRVPAGTPEAAPAAEASAGSGSAPSVQEPTGHDSEHPMDLPGGPKLNIRGFLDFNLGLNRRKRAHLSAHDSPVSGP
jgi:hypothetical protein